jgi:hypothetical protein
MKQIIYVITAVICVPLVFMASNATVYAILDSAPQETDHRVFATVKAVCDYAHSISDDGDSEEACGRALDASDTIYTCTLSDICNVTNRGL